MFNGIYKLKHLRNAFIALALLPQAAFSVTPLLDLGFESGTFGGWQPGGNNGGTAAIAVEGECFSVTDTTGIDLPGNYAAFIRSVGADANSFGTLTSPTFLIYKLPRLCCTREDEGFHDIRLLTT